MVTTFFLIDHTWLLHAFQTEAELDHFLTLNCTFTYGWVDSGHTLPVHSKYAS